LHQQQLGIHHPVPEGKVRMEVGVRGGGTVAQSDAGACMQLVAEKGGGGMRERESEREAVQKPLGRRAIACSWLYPLPASLALR
jgi:hypothetical protein